MNEFCNSCGSHIETATALGTQCSECENTEPTPWHTTEELNNLRNEVANENSLFADSF